MQKLPNNCDFFFPFHLWWDSVLLEVCFSKSFLKAALESYLYICLENPFSWFFSLLSKFLAIFRIQTDDILLHAIWNRNVDIFWLTKITILVITYGLQMFSQPSFLCGWWSKHPSEVNCCNHVHCRDEKAKSRSQVTQLGSSRSGVPSQSSWCQGHSHSSLSMV